MDKIYEVLAYPVNKDEEECSVQYWFSDSATPEMVREYRTKKSAVAFARNYAVKNQRGVEVLMEWEEGSDRELFRAFFYP